MIYKPLPLGMGLLTIHAMTLTKGNLHLRGEDLLSFPMFILTYSRLYVNVLISVFLHYGQI